MPGDRVGIEPDAIVHGKSADRSKHRHEGRYSVRFEAQQVGIVGRAEFVAVPELEEQRNFQEAFSASEMEVLLSGIRALESGADRRSAVRVHAVTASM